MNPRCSQTCSFEASRGKICFRLLLFLCYALGVAGLLLSQKDNDNYSKQREEMVRTQIATVRWSGSQAVQDPRVLDSMRKTPRHRLVPASSYYAYDDRPLPIGYGQTISQPYMAAKMTELLEPRGEHRVLEIAPAQAIRPRSFHRWLHKCIPSKSSSHWGRPHAAGWIVSATKISRCAWATVTSVGPKKGLLTASS